MDERIRQLAYNLIHNSVKLQKGQRIWISTSCTGSDVVEALVEETYRVGGMPFVELKDPMVDRAIMKGMTQTLAKAMESFDRPKMDSMDAYISIRGAENNFESSDIPEEAQRIFRIEYSQSVHSMSRVPKTNWVVLRWPTAAMAQQAKMSTRAFEDFYFSVCNLDYSKMSKAMDPLVERMQRTDRVRIVGPGTDLTFSIKGMKAVKCDGSCNIPDGEIYTAPVRESVNGTITYNTPSSAGGFEYENVSFTFQNGKIVEATCNDPQRIAAYLDTDEGARYVGEFAIGVNPNIKKAMGDTLFDEKIAGSIHFTPGNAYEDADNGNRSAIHWDLVLIQTPEMGGGEIYFDDELVRKDGRFVTKDLEALNPENLV